MLPPRPPLAMPTLLGDSQLASTHTNELYGQGEEEEGTQVPIR